MYNGKPYVPEPDLLATCKEIRHEALPIFYGNNTFEAFFTSQPDDTISFLDSLSDDKMAMIRTIRAYELKRTGWDPRIFAVTMRAFILMRRLETTTEHLSDIMEHGRSLLRRDAIYVPIREMDGKIVWCSGDDVGPRLREAKARLVILMALENFSLAAC